MHKKKMIISPQGMLVTSPSNVVDDLQKKGMQPLVVVIQVSEATESCSKETMAPSKGAPVQSQKTETDEKLTPKNKSGELFGIIDSALSNKEEVKSELEKRLENGHRDSENLRASEYA